ncbi:hypothetical protein ONZ43_g5798 [Nemania bipapillata]|uniref:Uncharacterized protein n=1 Tax=Nemania bipapillata TaxID=110536 RepID=A0ACC2I6F7_9PEZI|nr:hypothetical protein ONZ43_g5798 [Nemania bipapillata]
MGQSTQASMNREYDICSERLQRRMEKAAIEKRRITRSPTPPIYESDTNSWEWEGHWGEDTGTPAEEPLSTTPPSEDIEVEVGDAPEPSLAKRSRLNDNLNHATRSVVIDSKRALDYLRRGIEIAQGVVFEISSSRAPGWCHFEDGPHLVRFGRSELMYWIGEECPRSYLARNGHSADTVHSALLDIVPIRNSISHPVGQWLRCPIDADDSLRRVHSLAIILGDEKRAFEARRLRDELRDETNRLVQDVLDLYYLTLQPYAPKMEYKSNHVALFKYALRNYDPSVHSAQLMAVARMWARQEELDTE